MDKELGLTLFLVLLLCHKGNTDSQTPCPYKCQCFTRVQVLCADERMTALPTNIPKQVKDLIVMTSAVSYLLPDTLEGSPQLTKVVFFNNALQSIHSRAFEHLTELQELEISGNPLLEQLLLGTFSNQSNLTKLLLNFNRFKTVRQGMFDSLKQLETLQMKGNILLYLPNYLFLNLSNLKTLDLSQNKLEEVKRETFTGLDKLEILKINNNLLGNLTFDTFYNISQLIELHLEGNVIPQLSEGIFSTLTNLKVLNLRGNLLTTFSDNVFGFNASNLRELNLKGNRLIELLSLSHLAALSDLILSSNQLSNISEDIFRNFTLLENLDLSENQLTFLPEKIFNGLQTLQLINLHKNNLRSIEPKLFQDQLFIQQLYLSDNQLKTLPFGLLDTFVMQFKVGLHRNPWDCDCHMMYLHDWVQKNSLDIEMLDRVLCESPHYLRRRTVVSIDKDQLVCQVSKDEVLDLSSCSLQTSPETIIIKCKMDKCSPMAVKVQFQEVDGNVKEHILKNENTQCSNETMAQNSDQ